MNSTKKPPVPRGFPQPKQPAKAVQPKTLIGVVSPRQLVAPSRPQPPPKVLQKKTSPVQPPQPRQAPRPPFGPPVHAPKQTNLIQPKANLRSPFAATTPAVVQAKPLTPVRPALPSGRVVQPAISHVAGGGSVIQQGKPKAPKKKPQKKAVVTLTIDGDEYNGTSSGQYGHAEMEALRKFILDYDSVADASAALDQATKLKVRCPNQPICGSCTMILQALGFEARFGTAYSHKKSGGVSWGASIKISEFLDYRGLGATYRRALNAGMK